MKKLMILLFPMTVLMILFIFGVNSFANVHENPELTSRTISEPIKILFIGFGLIAFGSLLKRSSGRG